MHQLYPSYYLILGFRDQPHSIKGFTLVEKSCIISYIGQDLPNSHLRPYRKLPLLFEKKICYLPVCFSCVRSSGKGAQLFFSLHCIPSFILVLVFISRNSLWPTTSSEDKNVVIVVTILMLMTVIDFCTVNTFLSFKVEIFQHYSFCDFHCATL